MRARRAYRAKSVKQVNWELMSAGREGQAVHVGLDVGKQEVLAVVRWADGRFERPWLVKNPDAIGEFVGLLSRVNAERRLATAMEPTGTYGDALRQAVCRMQACALTGWVPRRRMTTRRFSTAYPRSTMGRMRR